MLTLCLTAVCYLLNQNVPNSLLQCFPNCALKNWDSVEGFKVAIVCGVYRMGYSDESEWSVIQASNGTALPLPTLNIGLLSKF